MNDGKNFQTLTDAGVIPQGYGGFTDAEKAAIENLSDQEVQAIVSGKDKLGAAFFVRHTPNGFIY